MGLLVWLSLSALVLLCVPTTNGENPRSLKRLLERNATRRREFCAYMAQHGGGPSCREEAHVEPGTPRTPSASEVYLKRHGLPAANSLNPVVMFPGMGGSSLQAEIDKNYKKSWECFKRWTWWGVWVNIYEMAFQTCWFDNMQLYYEPINDSFSNNPGVTIRPYDFGGLNGVNKLDHFDDWFGLTDVFQPMITEFEKIGYVGGKTMFGAPFDFRLPMNVLMQTDILGIGKTYEQALIELIEKAYTLNSLPVVLITHSMGGPTALYFLNQQPRAWRDKYIRAFIPIAGPWAGSAKALKALVSGDNLGLQIPLLHWSLLSLKDLTRNFRQYGGGAFLVPDPYYYPLNQPFVRRLKPTDKNYTANTLVDLFLDLGTPITAQLINDTKKLIDQLVHPSVDAYCLYGYGHPTEIHFTYESFPADPNDVNQPISIDETDMGDGTVPLFSLIECKHWLKVEHSDHEVNCKEYELKEHSQMLRDQSVALDILEILTGKSTIKGCEDPQTPMFVRAREEMQRRYA